MLAVRKRPIRIEKARDTPDRGDMTRERVIELNPDSHLHQRRQARQRGPVVADGLMSRGLYIARRRTGMFNPRPAAYDRSQGAVVALPDPEAFFSQKAPTPAARFEAEEKAELGEGEEEPTVSPSPNLS